jgi:predicted permease
MNMLRVWIARLVDSLRRWRSHDELGDEIHIHLELATRENMRRGMKPHEAALAARRAFGGVDQAKERCTDQRGLRWADDLLGDLRVATRLLRKDKSFTATALVTLAVCIGANVAIFSVVLAVLVRPLSVPQPDQVVTVTNAYPGSDGAVGDGRVGASVRHYLDRLNAIDVLDEQALYQPVGYGLDEQGLPAQYGGLRVTPSFFRVAGVPPEIGQTFTESGLEDGDEQQVVVSYAFWQGQLGGVTDVIGRELRLDGRPYDIVGVMPADFRFVRDDSWFWVPAVFDALERSDERRHANNWFMLGRLTNDGTLQQAQGQIDALNQRDVARFPAARQLLDATRFHTIVAPLHADMVGDVSGTLYLLWGGAVFVLLIGCVNLANLLVIRATTRGKEFGLRHAFGASRWRLARQLVSESLLLALLGALLGVPLGIATLDVARGLGVSTLPRGSEIAVDGVVVLAAIGTSLVIGLLLGLISFWRVSSAAMMRAVRQKGRSTTGDRHTRAVGSGLVAAQISSAFVLLIGALLMLVSLNRVLAIDPGFDTERLLTASISLPSTRYPTAAARHAFVERAVERLRGVGTIQQVGLGSAVPFDCGYCPSQSVFAEGVVAPEKSYVGTPYAMVNPSYFDALGIRLVDGRVFDARDTPSSARVVIVDEDLARNLWPERSPLGRRVSFTAEVDEDTRFYTVVGVVAGHAMQGLVESQARRGVHYFPLSQHNIWVMAFTIRTLGEPHAIIPDLRAAMATIDPELPLFDIRTMDERIGTTLALRRLPTVLSSGFALVAVFLAALGIYGVVAYRVTRRTKELAIRMALGSTGGRLLRLVISEGTWVLGIGLLFGAGGAFLVRDLLSSQLYDTQVTDVRVFIAVVLLLSTAAVVACAIPARRVVTLDPIAALNND